MHLPHGARDRTRLCAGQVVSLPCHVSTTISSSVPGHQWGRTAAGIIYPWIVGPIEIESPAGSMQTSQIASSPGTSRSLWTSILPLSSEPGVSSAHSLVRMERGGSGKILSLDCYFATESEPGVSSAHSLVELVGLLSVFVLNWEQTLA